MDIVAHGLWAAAAAKGINRKREKSDTENQRKPLNVWWAAFWGIFPDLFAFTPAFLWFVYEVATGHFSIANLPRPEHAEPVPRDTLPIFRLASALYNISHSAVVFFAVVLLVYLMRRLRRARMAPATAATLVPRELFGWLLHVLIDIPTHTYRFYPTPFLWPISGWKFDGLSWATPWFMVVNYSALIIIYLLLARGRKKATA